MKWLAKTWYKPHPIRWLLSPLSALYRCITWLRRLLYKLGIFKQQFLPVPVIIVGNITIGGTGKTPFVIWLAKQLQQAGFYPGIISRGYGGKADHYPQIVSPQSDTAIVGDEPVIISRQTNCPMVVAPNRVAAGKMLLQQYDCDIIIADDGLQHYALGRDVEIVVIDGQRLLGNGYCLPAGPLREPISRLYQVDFVIHNNGATTAAFNMILSQGEAINLSNPDITKPLNDFIDQTVHAVAGIGNPEQFFTQLTEYGLDIIPHPFSDHYQFQLNDLKFGDNNPILMTEKDAVKCQRYTSNNMWYIPLEVTISGKLYQLIQHKLTGILPHG